MVEESSLAGHFEEQRPRLTALASRMLGSKTEAEDAVQEAWIRFNRTDTNNVENLPAWLTTVVSRVCLNILQSRRTRPTTSFEDSDADERFLETEADPEREMLLADSVGLALLIVLDSLTPTERVAFVLHDMFAIPFEDIAPIVGRSATATRQLASRARRRVQHSETEEGPDRLRQSRLVEAFLAASREGDFGALVALLENDAVLHCDGAAVALGAPSEAYGAAAVGGYLRRARGAQSVLVKGAPAAAWIPDGQLRVVLMFTFSSDKIATIEAIAEPERLASLDLVVASNPWT